MIQKFKLPDEVFLKLKKNLQINTEPTNERLAGNIKKEYLANNCIPIIAPTILSEAVERGVFNKYISDSSFMFANENVRLYIHELWANFQAKGEFNPVHCHSGLLSFIVFVSIPYYAKQQEQISPGKKSNSDRAGMLEFVLSNGAATKSEVFKVDKTWEQYGLIFPSYTMHTVYPFFGFDEYRITMAGNIRFAN